jgi:hypothetical protein
VAERHDLAVKAHLETLRIDDEGPLFDPFKGIAGPVVINPFHPAEKGPDPGFIFSQPERLPQKIVRPRIQATHGIFRFVPYGEHQKENGAERGLRADKAAQLQTVALRKKQVGDDQQTVPFRSGLESSQSPQSLFSVVSRKHLRDKLDGTSGDEPVYTFVLLGEQDCRPSRTPAPFFLVFPGKRTIPLPCFDDPASPCLQYPGSVRRKKTLHGWSPLENPKNIKR